MTTIIDTPDDTTRQLAHLQADGIKTVIRYINPLNLTAVKTVKPAEAKALKEAGIRLGLVCEGWGDFAHGGISAGAGERDANACIPYAAKVGAPPNACIFYAVDTDASPTQIKKLVLPYFASIRARHNDGPSIYRIGVYGSGDVCSAVIGAGYADLAWLSCSTGWSGTKEYLQAKPKELVLLQGLPQQLAKLDVDSDGAFGDFGDFEAVADVIETQLLTTGVIQ